MKNYSVVWSDGSAAASRGGRPDQTVLQNIAAEDEAEMWRIAYICRKIGYMDDVEGLQDEDLLEEVKEYYGIDELSEDDEAQYLYEGDIGEDELEEDNLDGIDGGEGWIELIKCGRKKLFDNQFDEED